MPKPKPTPGERITRKIVAQVQSGVLRYDVIAKQIDAAVRRAAWEGRDTFFSMNNDMFTAKYGPAPKGEKQ